MSDPKPYEKAKVKIKNGEAEIEAVISAEMMQVHIDAVREDVRQEFSLPGFRKGQVPVDIMRQHVTDADLMHDAADLALGESYPAILESEKLEPMGRPRVTITKLAAGNPLEFKIEVPVVPEFSLPDYKKIGKKIVEEEKPVEVEDDEVNETVESIRKMRASSPDGKMPETLPELTDELAKTFGHFENVADFKAKVRESLKEEKGAAARGKRRETIAARLIEETKLTVPESAVAEELLAMAERRHEDAKKMDVSMEEYLKRLGKTEAELIKDEREYIERQAKTRLILNRIALQEHIEIDPTELQGQAEYLARRYPDTDPERVHHYVETLLMNEKTLELIEGKGLKPAPA